MIIIYNPTEKDCPEFNFEGSKIEGLKSKQLKQYEDVIANDMLDRWGFLEVKTAEEATALLNAPKEQTFKCEFCEFSTDHHLGFAGHMRKHKNEVAAKTEPAVDPSLIPVAGATKITEDRSISNMRLNPDMDELRNGVDRDGVEWYGEGEKEDNRSQTRVKEFGQGHFGG